VGLVGLAVKGVCGVLVRMGGSLGRAAGEPWLGMTGPEDCKSRKIWVSNVVNDSRFWVQRGNHIMALFISEGPLKRKENNMILFNLEGL
jgi:hypothetical protein